MNGTPMEIAPKPGIPADSWWTHAAQYEFTRRCEQEGERMRGSKEARRLGLPMVVGSLDGKSARTS